MKITACLVGSLVGDGWMKLPGLIDMCRENEVSVVAGSYALPVWEWGKQHLVGADYKIVEIIEDPDESTHQYCPGIGHPSMQRALADVKEQRPDENVIGGDDIPTYYNRLAPVLELREPIEQGSWIAVHPYTRHSWKNCRNVILRVTYPLPVKVLGMPGEVEDLPPGWEDCTEKSFDEQVAIVVGCRCFVGVGSSWSNVATLFHKPMIHVSWTRDLAQFTNPRMVKIFEPHVEELQPEIDRLCHA